MLEKFEKTLDFFGFGDLDLENVGQFLDFGADVWFRCSKQKEELQTLNVPGNPTFRLQHRLQASNLV